MSTVGAQWEVLEDLWFCQGFLAFFANGLFEDLQVFMVKCKRPNHWIVEVTFAEDIQQLLVVTAVLQHPVHLVGIEVLRIEDVLLPCEL